MSKLDDWQKGRGRPGQIKTVSYKIIDFEKERHGKKVRVHKNFGLPESGEVTLKTGYCPCSVCGHEYMYQCEAEDCACCSSTCT